MRTTGWMALIAMLAAAPAAAQQRPLVTEDPEVIGAGLILIEGGFDYSRDVAVSRVGPAGQPAAPADARRELRHQLDRGAADRRRHSTTVWRSPIPASAPRRSPISSTSPATPPSDVDDIVVATKIRTRRRNGGPPGVRRCASPPSCPTPATRAASASTRPTSMCRSLVGKTVRSIRIVGNVGLGILGDPTAGTIRTTSSTTVSRWRGRSKEGVELVGEVNGRASTTQRHAAGRAPKAGPSIRLGGRFTRGTVRIDGGILLGITSRDPSFGFTAGAT